MSCRSLNFFFWTVWSSDSVSRRNVREHAGRQSGIAWRGRGGGYDPCRRQTVQKKIKGWRRGRAPLRFPAPPHRAWRGMFRCRNRPGAKRRVLFPGACAVSPRVRRLGGLRRLWGRRGSPRGAAPFPGPAAHGHGGACSVVGLAPKRQRRVRCSRPCGRLISVAVHVVSSRRFPSGALIL